MSSKYRRFIKRGLIMLLLAILLVVGVFFFVQYALWMSAPKPADNQETPLSTTSTTVETSATSETVSVESDATTITESESAGGLYLRDLPLSGSQRSLAESFGVDVETYYLTPETINCAEKTLGTDRYQAIIAGEAPSFIEATKLLRCL